MILEQHTNDYYGYSSALVQVTDGTWYHVSVGGDCDYVQPRPTAEHLDELVQELTPGLTSAEYLRILAAVS